MDNDKPYNGKKYSRSQAHDKLYRLANKLLEKQNACSKCPIFLADTTKDSCGFSKAWCCNGCPHLGPTGCTVEALLCRLHLCADEGQRQYRNSSVLRKRQRKLGAIARSYNILLARASKEEALSLAPDNDIWTMYRRHPIPYTGVQI